MAGKKQEKRRAVARKAIREMFKQNLVDPYAFDNTVTEQLTDREFERVFKEIRKAQVTVSWKAGA